MKVGCAPAAGVLASGIVGAGGSTLLMLASGTAVGFWALRVKETEDAAGGTAPEGAGAGPEGAGAEPEGAGDWEATKTGREAAKRERNAVFMMVKIQR
jgi:hypothetical protein